MPCYIRWPGHFAGRTGRRSAGRSHRPLPDLARGLPGRLRPREPQARRQEPDAPAPRRPGRRLARSDALLPVASRRRARARPRLRRPVAALQAAPPRALRPEAEEPPTWSSTTSRTTPAKSTTSPPTTPSSSSGCTPSYLAWFRDVSSTRGFDPVRIDIGGPREDPTVLTRQDWRGPRPGWEPNDLGHWEVNVVRGGRFDGRPPADASTVPDGGPPLARRRRAVR